MKTVGDDFYHQFVVQTGGENYPYFHRRVNMLRISRENLSWFKHPMSQGSLGEGIQTPLSENVKNP